MSQKIHYPLSRQPFSVVIIAKNAARQLAACLDSASFADEIVVVDSGSSDGSGELAAKHGARVMQKEWLGFGRQKQFAVEAARHDWVLCLDADERVSEPLRASILGALAAPRRGLSGLELAPVRPAACALERRSGARKGAHRRAGGAHKGRPAA